jgi:hypothetical protein
MVKRTKKVKDTLYITVKLIETRIVRSIRHGKLHKVSFPIRRFVVGEASEHDCSAIALKSQGKTISRMLKARLSQEMKRRFFGVEFNDCKTNFNKT